jgi:DNA-binding MarR family transcriptional regulator
MPRQRRTGPTSAEAADKTAGALRLPDELSRVVPRMDAIIGYKLRRAQLSVFQDFLQTFSKMKLRPAEFSVLAMIADTPGQKQTEIAGQLGIKRANFVALMDGLERRGLAERRKTETDKRSHSLHLTAEGVRFVKKMSALWREHEERLVQRLGGPAEKDRLIALLDRIFDPAP